MREATIVIEVPENLKPLAEAFEKVVAQVQLARASSRGGRAVPYENTERVLAAACAEVEREGYAATLAALAVDARRIMVRGKTYNRFGRSEGIYRTAVGEVRVSRTLYREAGVRNGPVLDPIATRAGMINQGWCPSAWQGAAHLLQQGTAREAEATARTLGRLPYCASSFERVGHLVGEAYRQEQADIEDALIGELDIPENAASIAVALDQLTVPMEEEVPRPPGRPRKNAPRRSIQRVFRMAACGTVTIHDREGRALHTIRYGAMPDGDAGALCDRMASDAFRLKQARPDVRVVLLADGAHELWKLLEAHFPESVFGPRTLLVDFWHLIEKLGAAASVVSGEDKATATLARWKRRLTKSARMLPRILSLLERSGRQDVRVGDQRPVHEAITYLRNHSHRMNYAAARRVGLPIGSGNVEATAKSLFTIRFKRPGSRWHNDTGENIVQLRALALSHRWDSAMDRLAATRRTAVRVVAA